MNHHCAWVQFLTANGFPENDTVFAVRHLLYSGGKGKSRNTRARIG